MVTQEVMKPIFTKTPELQSMDDLEITLEEISQASRTSKLWIEFVVKPTLLMMLFGCADHKGAYAFTYFGMLPYIFAANHYN